jgi:predicted extracellular nuclease
VNTNITVTFSEAVTAVDPWYSLTCGTQTITTSPSGSGTTYTIDPTADLPLNTSCTLTITGNQVTDQDGTADPVAGTPTISFTTAASDAAPEVSAVTPTNGSTSVPLTSNLTVTFNEAVNVTGDWYNVTSGSHAAIVSGGPTAFTLDLTSDLAANETCTATIYAAYVSDQDLLDPPDNMAADYQWSFSTGVCSGTYTRINVIQGSGVSSPLTGTVVTTEGIVTADRNATGQLGGFFLQAPPADDDGNALTSEGIFVYSGLSTFAEGDRVRVTGTVTEYKSAASTYGQMYNMTEISPVTELKVCSSGHSIPPTTITLPIPGDPATYLESYEGMLVTVTGGTKNLYVMQNYFLGRFGQLTIGVEGLFPRVFHAWNGTDPATYTANIQRMLILDDGKHAENPSVMDFYPTDNYERAGDQLAPVTGVLDQGKMNSASTAAADFVPAFPYIYYRLHPTITPVFTRTNARPVAADTIPGEIKVANANVLNYFTTYSGAGGRGADNEYELDRQRCKLVSEMVGMDADILGLMEIENNGTTALDDLLNKDDTMANGIECDGLNVVLPGTENDYTWISDPALGYGSDQIKVTIIYRASVVTPVGSAVSTNAAPFNSYRHPVAQTFQQVGTGEKFTVVVNHFKSKRCDSATGADADQGEGRGCYNATRINMATVLLNWIATTIVPVDPDVLIIGDLNAYGGEDPINTLTSGGYINLIQTFVPGAQQYTYVFDGTAGYLDHSLGSTALLAQIEDVTIWHINADEPFVIEYSDDYKVGGDPVANSPDLYQPHAYRASDHDPVLTGITLNDAPSASAEAYTVLQDTTNLVPAATGLLLHASDNDPRDTLTAVKVSDPLHGSLTLDADGSFSYTPFTGFTGEDSFTYKVYDGKLYSNTATVTLTVLVNYFVFLPIISH